MIGAALANERFFEGERGNLARRSRRRPARHKTSYFNKNSPAAMARLMSLEPLTPNGFHAPCALDAPGPRPHAGSLAAAGTFISLNASRFSAQSRAKAQRGPSFQPRRTVKPSPCSQARSPPSNWPTRPEGSAA